MNLLKSVHELSLKPFIQTLPLLKDNNQDLARSINVRLRMVADLVVSCFACILIFITGLGATAMNSSPESKYPEFEVMSNFLKIHLIVVIPTSVFGIFANFNTTISVFAHQKGWVKYKEPLFAHIN